MALKLKKQSKQKNQRKANKNDFIYAFKGSEHLKEKFDSGDKWVDTEQCYIAEIKIDRKTKDQDYLNELAASMSGKKQINAAIVRKAKDGRYELINGECRYDAAKINNEPLLVRVVDYDDDEAIGAIIAENDKRKDLCDYDKALAYLEYKSDLSIRAFAEKYNLNRNYVNRLFKVDKIPESVVLALPMIELSASQFEEIAIRIKDNQLYTDVFIELAPLLSQIETPVTWKDFLSRIDRKVNPPEKQPQRKSSAMFSALKKLI
ncbi:ParB/RepB/Spo0J family partition protein (plasmid) [Piscirickettsia salmonis]|uniref:ParB/RepB/Spo0J family partition protein n=1 Tax=Piscirickettsia salmonis TaxID=1238 RepID=UPI00137BD521|nr:ParB/RepB/Spo0J family partition protein [Piscirickettsia salmonis]QHS31090.1 ParB/RepB/Spo0J family partition protein [Piscirickettsia salmonis]